MFGSSILDVAIGIVFVFLLTSLIASAVREGLEAVLKTRSAHLEAGLREILKDPQGTGLVAHLYNHPLVYSLYSGDYAPNSKLKSRWMSLTRAGNLPSYIPSRNFAIALMDMAARGPQITGSTASTGPVTLEAIRSNVGSIENPAVQRALLIALDGAAGDLAKAQASLEAWYNSAMDRVSGWYKRSTQLILLGLGFVLAVGLNINTIRIGDTLYHDKTARDLIVASAEKVQSSSQLSYKDANEKLGDLRLFIGWPTTVAGVKEELEESWFTDIPGWILTALAVSVGAPFWFDMLNRLIVIRSTVKPHQKSPEDASIEGKAAPAPVPDVPAAAPPQAALPAPSPPVAAAAPPPPVPDADGCDVDMTANITTDEMLPEAKGGIAS